MKRVFFLCVLIPFCSHRPVSAGSASDVIGTSLSSTTWSLSWAIPNSSTPTVVLSTHSDFSTNISSGMGSLGQTTTGYANLEPNTTHYFKVKNSTEPDSEYTTPVSTITWAAVPGAPSFSAVSSAGFTTTWPTNGNPSSTLYEASHSTDDFQTHFSTPVPFSADLTANSTALYNLMPGTTYYVRIRASNGDSIITGFSTTGSTVTVPAPLSGLTGEASDPTSIQWSWGSSGGGATRYDIFSSSSGAWLQTTGALVYLQSDLSTNTAYGIQVQPFTTSWSQPLSDAVTTYTLAAPPLKAGVSFPNVYPSSITVQWESNGNPSDTPYEAGYSTDNFVTHFSTPVSFSQNFVATTTTFFSLEINTTYYVRIRAQNSLSTPTAFTYLDPISTLAQSPGAISIQPVGTDTIPISWGPNGNPATTNYEVSYSSVDAFNTGPPISTATLTTATNLTLGNLQVRTTYYIRVRALNGDGQETNFAANVSTRTLPTPSMLPNPFSLLLPVDGAFQSPLDVQPVWEQKGSPIGNPLTYTLYYSTCTGLSCPGTVLGGLSGGSTNVPPSSLQAGTTYYWRVEAWDTTLDIVRRSDSDFRFIVSSSRVTSPDGSVRVQVLSELPANALVTIKEIKASDDPLLSRADRLAARERRFHVLPEKDHLIVLKDPSGNIVTPPDMKAQVSFDYPDPDATGFYKGTPVRVEHLQIVRLEKMSGQWELLPQGVALDRQNKRVTGLVDKFSHFTLLGSVLPSSVLTGARNFPNPFRAGREETIIQYTLTENAQVTFSIYTAFGDLVLRREFGPGTDGGRGQPTGYANKISWDGRNGQGEIVANGVYVCRIEVKTGDVTKKIVRLIGVKK